ncbi:MAG: N-acetyltransferase [Planctomycetota bacterium]
MAYHLVPTTVEDRPWLDELRRAAYLDLFVATWGGWDEERHTRHFNACLERGAISAIELDGIRVGMIQLSEQADAVEICEIQIHPSHQSRGIGTRLIQDTMAQTHAERKKVRLSAGLQNLRAVKLYRRLGFVEVAQTETHYHMESEPSLGAP